MPMHAPDSAAAASPSFPPPPPRRLPGELEGGDLEALAPHLEELSRREVRTPPALAEWLLDLSELAARIDAAEAQRYIAWARATEDPEARSRHREFQERVKPALRPRLIALDRKFMQAEGRAGGGGVPLRLYARLVAAELEIFRDENIALEAEESRLETRYGELAGAWTVLFRGAERTLQELGLDLEESDRALREEAWRLGAARRLEDRRELDACFTELVALRDRMARASGRPDYRSFAFLRLKRFDYDLSDCVEFHGTVESVVLPAAARLARTRMRRLGLQALRPWDTAVDTEGRRPLRPFSGVDELLAGAGRVLEALAPALAGELAFLVRHGLTDLESRKGKTPGAFCYPLEDVRLPFLFANAAGSHRDVRTLFHEAGHAFHCLAAREIDLLALRGSPIEFAEVASMGLELLAAERIGEWYAAPEAARALAEQLRETLLLLPWIAAIDSFQHWVYAHPGATVEERSAAWVGTHRRFTPFVEWGGLEREEAALWHRQPHLFQYPFYYFEYAVAQLGALQLWTRFRKEGAAAVDRFRGALRLGGTAALPDLFAAAGLRLEFSPRAVEGLVAEAMAALEAAGEVEP